MSRKTRLKNAMNLPELMTAMEEPGARLGSRFHSATAKHVVVDVAMADGLIYSIKTSLVDVKPLISAVPPEVAEDASTVDDGELSDTDC